MAEDNKEEEVVEEKADEATDDLDESTDNAEKKEEDSADTSDKTDEVDWDKELEEETASVPDPVKAKDAFKERQTKKQDEDDSEDDLDKPLTRRDRAAIVAEARKDVQKEQALTIARGMAGSEKEALVIAAKWGNRTFPDGMSLQDQLEEAYAITHRKKLIGTANEAMRALKAKSGVKTDSSSAQRDATPGVAPKQSSADAAAYKQAGFVWDSSKRLYKKPLKGGRLHLYKDPKSKKQWTAA